MRKHNNIFNKGKNPKDARKSRAFPAQKDTRPSCEENRRFSAPKGFIYTLEVLIAVSIILVSLVFLFRSPPAKPALDTSVIKTQGMNALMFMDAKGTLRKNVFNGNETQIETELKMYLPKNIGFEAELCTLQCSTVNVPANETVVALDYYISGYNENYLGKKVKLWLWRKS